MPQARDEAGNIWETDAQGNAVRLIRAAQAAPNVQAIPESPGARADRERSEGNAYRDQVRTDIAARGESRDINYKQYDNTLKLRSDFDALPEVKEYRTAVKQLAQGLKTGDTPQGDLALIYAYAKVMDPGSVVREGEVASVANADTIAGQIVASMTKQLSGSGSFSPQARKDFREEMLRKVQELNTGYNQQRERFTADAQSFGLDPERVIGPHDGRGFLPDVELGLRRNRGVDPASPSAWQPGDKGLPEQQTPFAQDSGRGIQAATGQTKRTYDDATANALDAMFRAGASAAELDAFAKSRNPGYSVPADQVANMRAYLQSKAGRNYKGTLFNAPLQESETTIRERLSASRPAAVGIGIGNGVGMGALDALAPDQMALARQANPGYELGGEVLGAIGATKGIGAVGRGIASRLAPGLLGGGELAQFGRNLAVDSTYGGVYGENSGQGALPGAAYGALGSAGGQVAGATIGAGIGGLARSPAAAYLASRGIPMTVGQNLGGAFKAIEDKATSLPLIGDMIGRRRREAFDAFNRSALNEAGAPVGATVNQTGEAGLDSLMGQIGNSYDNATNGVNVPLDPQFNSDLTAIGARSRLLPPELNELFGEAMDNAVQPVALSGEMTGRTYQQSMRGLKGYKAELTKPGFEADYRGLLSDAQSALKGQMQRGGGQGVVDDLGKADEAYRNAKVLQKAIAAAKNGSATGDIQVFSPAQLNTAAYQAAAKYPGPRPFAELADAGQQVLPNKIPDSGTAGRALQALLPAALAGGVAGHHGGGGEGAAAGTAGATALAILATLGGTKAGQHALNKALFGRPDSLKAIGSQIGKRKGLFGAASVPLLLEATN